MDEGRDNRKQTKSARERARWLLAIRVLAALLIVLGLIGGADVVGVLALLISVVVVAAMVRRCRACAPSEGRRAGLLLTAGLACWLAGSLTYTTRVTFISPSAGPAPWDLVGWLAFYPLVAAALMTVARQAESREHGMRWDGAIAALSVGALAITVIVEIRQRFETNVTSLLSVINLLWDLLLLASTVGMVALLRWRSARFLAFLIGGFAAFTAADVAYCAQATFGAYSLASLINVGYGLAAALFAHAVWEDARPASAPAQYTWRRLLMPIGLAALAVLVLANGGLQHNPVGGAVALAALGAVLVRLAVAYRDTQRAYHSQRAQARTDSITGLGNRYALNSSIDRGFTTGDPVVLVLADLDGFKVYNDTYGHAAGDQLLARLGARLQRAVAPVGSAFRIGGDEFCVLAAGDAQSAPLLARRVQAALRERGPSFEVCCSVGYLELPGEAPNAQQALKLADERMYAAKHERRGSASQQARAVLLGVVRERNRELLAHGDDVADLAVALAQQLGLSDDETRHIRYAAELHDIGKVAIPDIVLDKPGPLDDDEWAFIRQHTLLGERIMSAAPALTHAAKLVRASHERWDGTGYPDGLAGDTIPLGARIIAVCDAWDAMTTDRPYRAALSVTEALTELDRHAGHQFDPAVIDAFRAHITTQNLGYLSLGHDEDVGAENNVAVLAARTHAALDAAGAGEIR